MGPVTIKLRARGLTKNDLLGKADPYLRISKKTPGKDEWDMVFKGGFVKQTLDPDWPQFQLSLEELGGPDAPLLWEVLDYDTTHKTGPEGMQDDYHGFLEASLNELKAKPSHKLYNPLREEAMQKAGKPYEGDGDLLVDQVMF
ncbi:hypothetical protein DFJ74DRAFT_688727 [Hyaloraphidium curvatum]|nr:hypothetical protein DFJ74DRAFT_688727 [Hyaloraphidium curvatum]